MIFFVKNKTGITYSNRPITDDGIAPMAMEASDAELEAIESGEKEIAVVDGKGIIRISTKKAEREALEVLKVQEAGNQKTRKLELIKNITDGKATKEEQEEFANLI